MEPALRRAQSDGGGTCESDMRAGARQGGGGATVPSAAAGVALESRVSMGEFATPRRRSGAQERAAAADAAGGMHPRAMIGKARSSDAIMMPAASTGPVTVPGRPPVPTAVGVASRRWSAERRRSIRSILAIVEAGCRDGAAPPNMTLGPGAATARIKARPPAVAVEPVSGPAAPAEATTDAVDDAAVSILTLDGGVYTGALRDGRPHGAGTWTCDGRTVRGVFIAGKPNGVCDIVCSSGPAAVHGSWTYAGDVVCAPAASRACHALRSR